MKGKCVFRQNIVFQLPSIYQKRITDNVSFCFQGCQMDKEDLECIFPEDKVSLEVKLVSDTDNHHFKENTTTNGIISNTTGTTTSYKICNSLQDSRERITHFMQHNHKFHLFVTLLVALDVAVIIVQLILEASRKVNLDCSRYVCFYLY